MPSLRFLVRRFSLINDYRKAVNIAAGSTQFRRASIGRESMKRNVLLMSILIRRIFLVHCSNFKRYSSDILRHRPIGPYHRHRHCCRSTVKQMRLFEQIPAILYCLFASFRFIYHVCENDGRRSVPARGYEDNTCCVGLRGSQPGLPQTFRC